MGLNITKLINAVVKAAPTIAKVVTVVPVLWRVIRPPKAPAPPPEPALLIELENQEPVNDLITFLKNFALSAVKSVAAAVVAGLTAFLTVGAPADPIGFAIWGAIAVAVRAAISAIQRLLAVPAKPSA